MRDEVLEAELRETLREMGTPEEMIDDILEDGSIFGDDARDYEDEYPRGGRFE